jgi:hypothetical protein
MPLLFQYGSNCLTARLNSPHRLNGSAVVQGRAQTVDEYDLAFDVWSQTNGCAASNLIPAPGTGRHAWGVLYEVPADLIRGKNRPDGRRTLEEIEGRRYEELPIRVRDREGNEVENVTTFLVKSNERRDSLWTSVAYVSWIVYGMREHGVPEDYIAHIQAVAKETNAQSATSATEQTRIIDKL